MPKRAMITADYEIVTPMFIGDAAKKATTISPGAVKGALRFWWRALNWGRIRKLVDGDAAALRQLHQEEGRLFGRVAEIKNNKQMGGQGDCLLRVRQDRQNLRFMSAQNLNQDPVYKLDDSSWQSYLLGLGLANFRGYLKERSAYVSGKFSVAVYCRGESCMAQIRPVLLLWGLLGGLGSRNRKGVGSISIRSLDGEDIPQDRETLVHGLKGLLVPENLHEDTPPFTAFSHSSRILISEESGCTPWEALGSIAQIMQCFRGWGYQRKGGHYIKGNTKASHTSHS
jgi:CRISPR-associated protein Cmr1